MAKNIGKKYIKSSKDDSRNKLIQKVSLRQIFKRFQPVLSA